ncbi:MAG TPA: putative toxin-antitoxin system toxin component, PIN family [Gemmatimonadaceae bacterium]
MSSSIERIVLDTNVLVSAFLNFSGAPAQVLTLVLAGELKLVFDRRILDEYAEVLARPRFGLDSADVTEVLRQLEADGERIATPPSAVPLPDADDLPFLEVALSGRADALVTGNLRHFPGNLGVDVLSPRALLQRLEAEQ